MYLRELRRKWNSWLGGRTSPPTRVGSVLPYERSESVSVGPGLSSFPPIALEMYQVVFEMDEVVVEVYVGILTRKWIFWRGGGLPR